jgi:SWI/SNF-related matrix-associated actin-dependent regulator 1 of chromatin subfamily A
MLTLTGCDVGPRSWSTEALYSYQRKSIDFAEGRRHTILAHDPGLGKSAIAIHASEPPVLVLCPASLVVNWRREVEKWRPEVSGDTRILSYASPKLPAIRPRHWSTVVVDECHFIKNPDANRTRLACRLLRHAKKSLALSGTLVPNRPIELWPLLYAMGITEMSYVDFAFRFAAAYENEWHDLDVRGSSNEDELRELLAPHCIRYTKEQALPELPDLTWRVIALDLPLGSREKDFSLEDLVRMREQVAFEAMSEVLHEHGIRKLPLVVEHVRTLMESLQKVIVFAHHRDVIAALAGALEEFHPVTVIGGQSRRRRQVAVDRFQKPSSSARLLIGQLEAAGVGHNMTAASHVVFAEGSWVPSVLKQAADRAHRIGTRKNVTADLLTITGSIDEHMLRRALEKQEVIDKIVPTSLFTSDETSAILYS